MNTRNLRFRTNRVRDIVALFRDELTPIYGRGEVDAFLEILFDDFLGWNKVRLLSERDATVDQSDLLRFHWALEDLLRHRPVQHIVGHTDFCGCRIAVSPDVLIPRPETEQMVMWILSEVGKGVEVVLDLCTGSGCIAIALKRAMPQAVVVAADISAAALAVAERNARDNGAELELYGRDVLNEDVERWPECDLIVSNPPYVRESERGQMADNVLLYEPQEALFVGDDDPLVFYRAVARVAKRRLRDGGMTVVEVNEALADETASLLSSYGFATSVYCDLYGRPRWVAGRRNG